MKKILLFCAFCMISMLNAQLTISTNYREDGVWNADKNEWVIESTEEGLTVFNFDSKFSSFTHITKSITSEYEILDWDYDEKEVLYEMTVKSDAGNTYDFLVDGINDYIIFFYTDSDNSYRMVRHTVSDSSFKE